MFWNAKNKTDINISVATVPTYLYYANETYACSKVCDTV